MRIHVYPFNFLHLHVDVPICTCICIYSIVNVSIFVQIYDGESPVSDLLFPNQPEHRRGIQRNGQDPKSQHPSRVVPFALNLLPRRIRKAMNTQAM